MKEAHEDLNPSIAPEFRNEPERFYVPQFATAATVEQEILNRETADMNRPEWNWCGICCVQMILRSLGDRRIPSLEEMYERATSPYRVYRVENQRVVGAYLIIVARSLGLDVGAMSGITNAIVDEAFFPDGRFKSNFLCNIGYGDPTKLFNRSPRLSFEDACRLA